MEIDTGSSVSLMSKQSFNSVFGKCELASHSAKLRTYTGEEILVLGSLVVEVQYNEQKESLTLLVIDSKGPNLMGRDWLTGLNWIGRKFITMDLGHLFPMLMIESKGQLAAPQGPCPPQKSSTPNWRRRPWP
jgi:hypothetical protein